MSKFFKNNINDVYVISSLKHKDKRGFFSETYKVKDFPKIISNKKFILEGHAFSKKRNTLRGIHFQTKNPQCQILQIITGKIKLVLVDLRFSSKTFKNISYLDIDSSNNNMVYMPPGVGSAYLTKTNDVNILYKMNKYFDASSDAGIKWNCDHLKIKWFTKKPILSNKDRVNKGFKYFDFEKLNLK